MKNYVVRTLILALVTVSFVACGKSKNDSAPVGAATGAPPPQNDNTDIPAPDTSDTNAEKADTDKEEESKTDTDTPKPGEETDGKEATEPENDQPEPAVPAEPYIPGEPPVPGNSGSGQTAPQAPAAPKTSNSNSSPKSPSGTSGVAVACSQEGLSETQKTELKRLLGNSLRYTGAARDGIRETYQEIANSQCNLANLQLADSIEGLSLGFTHPEGSFGLAVKMKVNGVLKTAKLFGDLKEDRKGDLNVVRSRNTTGLQFRGSLECLDAEPNRHDQLGCETAVVHLEIGKEGQFSKVTAIVRNTSFNIEARFAEQDYRTPGEVQLRDFLGQRSVLKKDYVRKTFMETFEVINGKSGFKGKLISNRDINSGRVTVLAFSGPLVDTRRATPYVAIGSRAMSEGDDQLDGQYLHVSDHVRTIKGAALIDNDGSGYFTVRLGLAHKAQGEDYADLFIHLDPKGINEIEN